MVFSSVPVYLDPPNWQQQQGVGVGGGGLDGSQLPPPPPPPTGTTIRPNSMAERARMAKIPQPEAALKCPRCESTNTKFCYFNNYSLSQPRHFCKTCRRYWTRGGALRSVPVGGGCRRNKRSSKRRSSSSSRSKSPAVLTDQSQAEATATAAAGGSSSSSALMPNLQQQMTMFPSLHHLTDYNSGDIGLNFTGIQSQGGGSDAGIGFQVASTGGSILPSNGLVEQWKLQQQVQQFPFFSAANGLYSFDPDQAQSYSNIIKPAMALDSAQVANMKMEESGTKQRLNFSRNFLGSINNLSANDHHHQYWGASNSNNALTDLSGFTSSSTSHLL